MANRPTNAIEGLEFHPRRVIPDARGDVLHMLRRDDEEFTGFGEVYFSEIRPGQLKAWKLHRRMTQRFAVPVGAVRFVIHDPRPSSPTRGATVVWVVGRDAAYGLLVVPPGVWYGFQAVTETTALIVNCADLQHDPEESESVPPGAPGAPSFAW